MIDSYIISLKKQTEPESQKLIKNIKNLDANLNPVWFNGINGKTTDLQQYKHHFDQKYFNILSKGAIGCALSHLYVWKQIASSEKEYSIVFEDDVVFKDDFKIGFDTALENVPKDYDILMLGYLDNSNPFLLLLNFLIGSSKLNKIKINDYIEKPRCSLQFHAYILSKKGAEKLIKLIDGRMFQHIDYNVNQFFLKDELNIYCIKNRIAFQTSAIKNSSNISSKFPINLNNICSTIYLDEGLPLSYITNVDILSLEFLNVNLITIIALFIGIILSILNVNVLYTTLAVLLFCIPDLRNILTKGDTEHLKQFVFIYIVLITPSLIKISWNKIKKSDKSA